MADPFAAAAPVAAAQEVRLIIDDKAVDDADVGRKGFGKLATGLAITAIVGVLIGWVVGSTVRERQLFDLALQDAKDVYGSVNTASTTVTQASKLIDQALKAAAPGPGKTVEVDFKAIEDLRALAKPFPADVFSRKRYGAFAEPGTVDSLFLYYNNTNILWAKIATIAAKSLSPTSREALTKAAKAAGDLAATEYGCVPFKDGDAFRCGLMPVKSGEEGKVNVITRSGTLEKSVFAGQAIADKPSDFVIMVDKGRSNDILGATTDKFQTYARDLMEAKQLADQTTQVQGQLIQQLGNIAKLSTLN
ncbi:MAG: hypothetical protein QM778_09900 [Myxococcales bacterium]